MKEFCKMYDFKHAPADIIAEREKLAEQVQRELELAGVVAFQIDVKVQVGAEIEVDRGDDAAGGVFVTWKPHPTLSTAAVESLQNGEYQAQAIRHHGTVIMHMRDAIIGILVSAGFRAEISDDDMRPFVVRVWGRSRREIEGGGEIGDCRKRV
ncbi:hypothetical protein [Streptomyces noursei]|uniref:hypothetical protein n=1 Tax=Streptomyces noursei TaxID=1971 RepID=UPI000F58413E|nr:hypothetical protein [Streptomyces noursei]UWS70387.1 hypothetical protein N1H47_03585 [Streptomyces noursei]